MTCTQPVFVCLQQRGNAVFDCGTQVWFFILAGRKFDIDKGQRYLSWFRTLHLNQTRKRFWRNNRSGWMIFGKARFWCHMAIVLQTSNHLRFRNLVSIVFKASKLVYSSSSQIERTETIGCWSVIPSLISGTIEGCAQYNNSPQSSCNGYQHDTHTVTETVHSLHLTSIDR